MADGQPIERARDRLLPRVQALDLDGKVKRHSKAIAWLEAVWQDAVDNARTDMEQRKAEAMLERIVRFHKDADILANEHAQVPMPRNGSR